MLEPVFSPRFLAALRPHLTLLQQDATIRPDLDLAAAGLDSLAMVALLVDLEGEFQVTIPDAKLSWDTFRTPQALWATIEELMPVADD